MKGFRSVLVALTAAGTLAALSAPASAQYYRRGWNPGAAAAVGVLGGLAVGGAIAASRPAYAAPVYGAPVYGPAEDCWVERRRVWDGYGYRVYRETVCQ